jgi:hypothetical protein
LYSFLNLIYNIINIIIINVKNEVISKLCINLIDLIENSNKFEIILFSSKKILNKKYNFINIIGIDKLFNKIGNFSIKFFKWFK